LDELTQRYDDVYQRTNAVLGRCRNRKGLEDDTDAGIDNSSLS